MVVGAGLAGLTTALDLVASGWDVVVLEARDRVGGRVKTLRTPFSAGLHAEAGGESIDDGHDQLLAMLLRFGIKTERRAPLKPYDATTFVGGRRLPLAAFLAGSGGKVLTDYLRFGDAVAALATGVDPDHPEQAANASALDAMDLGTFVKAQGLVPDADFLVRRTYGSEYNCEVGSLSMLFVAQQEAVVSSGGGLLIGAETMRVSGGNDRLPLAMAAALGDRVRLGHPVRLIEHRADGVRVHAAPSPAPAAVAPVDAAWLVLAAPVPPLRRVRFDPVLPAAVAAMIAGLDLGQAAKVVREYSLPFWSAEGVSGFTLTDLSYGVGWSPTDSYVATAGILSQFITGDAARIAASLPELERIDTFGAQLDRVLPEGVPLSTDRRASMAWLNEPYTGGGYAVFQPGQMAPFWPVLREGTGRIRFAGEHTSSLAGYMESAVRSGHRAAALVGRPPPA